MAHAGTETTARKLWDKWIGPGPVGDLRYLADVISADIKRHADGHFPSRDLLREMRAERATVGRLIRTAPEAKP